MEKALSGIRFLIATLVILTLSACSGGGTCKGCQPPGGSTGALQFKIISPTEFPAGVAVTANLTLLNTSNVAAINLVFPAVIESTDLTNNSTGADIAINPGVCGSLTSLAPGESCPFSASIPASSHPGTFTVTVSADPINLSAVSKVFQSIKKAVTIQSISYTVSVNIGLASVPASSTTPLYIFPANQTLNIASGESTLANFSLLVESAANSINIYKDSGSGPVLVTTLRGPFSSGSVVQFSVYLPNSDVGIPQTITANSETCSANCSNQGMVTLAESGAGILSLSPTTINMSSLYLRQIYTVVNTGAATVSNIQLPSLPASLSLLNGSNTCTSESGGSGNGTLAVNGICSFSVVYSPNGIVGDAGLLVIGYNNGLNQNKLLQFRINILGYAAISIESVEVSRFSNGVGTFANPFQVESQVFSQLTLTYINNGPSIATNLNIESVMLDVPGYSITTNNCNMLPSLNVAESCTLILNVPTAVVAPQNLSLLNSSVAVSWVDQTQSHESQEVDWINPATNPGTTQSMVYLNVYPAPAVNAGLYSESSGAIAIESITNGTNFYLYYNMTGGYPGESFTYSPTIPSGMFYVGESSCNVSTTNQGCSIKVNSGGAAAGESSINFGNAGGTLPTIPVAESITIYPIPYIKFTSSGLTVGESVLQGESFTVTATLNGGFDIANQTIAVASLTPSGESINAVPSSCTVSSSQSSCNLQIATTKYITSPESYILTMQDATSAIRLESQVINFNVVLPHYAQIFIESATLNPLQSAGNGGESGPYQVESQTISILTLKYVNRGNGAAFNFKVNGTNPLPVGYSESTTGTCINNFILESNSGNSCTMVFNVPTATVGDKSLLLESLSLPTSWVDESNTFESQALNWINTAANTIQDTVYLNVYTAPVVYAGLYSESSGTTPIESTFIGNNFYLHYNMIGGYPGESFIYSPTIPGSMAFVNESSCMVSYANQSCSIEVNPGSTTGSNTIDYGNAGGRLNTTPESSVIAVNTNGYLAISAYAESEILVGESTFAIVSLESSVGITSPITVTITNNNGSIITIDRGTCNLTTAGNSCVVSLYGLESGSATFGASSPGYTSQSSGVLVVVPVFAYFTNTAGGQYTQCLYNNNTSSIESSTCANHTMAGTGVAPVSIAIDNQRNLAYVVNATTFDFTQCNVDTTGIEPLSCFMVIPSGSGAMADPSAMDFDPVNNYVYVTNTGLGSGHDQAGITQCPVDTNGIESVSCVTTISPLMTTPQGITTDNINHKVYIVNDDDPGYFTQCPVTPSGVQMAACSNVYPASGIVTATAGGITFDESHSYIYIVADTYFSPSISQCQVDGSGIESATCTNFGVSGLTSPNTITAFRGNAYITDSPASYFPCTTGVSGIITASCAKYTPTTGALSTPRTVSFGQ